jgi:hypothetical protein
MKPEQIIGAGITASAIAHLSVLALVFFFAEVHPFGSVTAKPIAVDIVTPEEIAEKQPEPPLAPKIQPSDAFDLSSKPAASSSPAPAASPEPAAPPQRQAAAPPTPQSVRPQASAPPPPAPTTPTPGYAAPEPDLTLKYHVMLGLPPALPQNLPQDKPGDGFDAPASEKADVASSLVTEFRNHLKTCSKLPEAIALTDKIKIKLRVMLAPDGRLAAKPVLIEASASAKGPALMQGAIGALETCQPYAMLPAARYGEWKILDLNFTPQDFTGG